MISNAQLARLAASGLVLLLTACGGQVETPRPTADPATRSEAPAGTFIGFSDPRGVHVWRGLRYAEPADGANRWRAPQPPAAATTEVEAIDFGDVCPQIGSMLGGAPTDVQGELWGDEDCLFLNVYAPAEADDSPVLVWIHGGGNTIGHAGFYDGTPLAAAHDVVVVTLNYRLGPLGWFRHPALAGDDADDASGNYGTLDLVQALRWVQENIAAFGGDPDRVVVFGESAGATNIASLLVSPHAAGLFHGAVLQSGGTSSASAANATNRIDADEPGARFSSQEILLRAARGDDDAQRCPRSCAIERADALELDAQAALLRDLSTAELFSLYADGNDLLGPNPPTVIRDGAVLPAAPFIDVLGTPGAYNAVPVMLGTNRDEPKIFMVFDPSLVTSISWLPLWPRDEENYELRAEYGARAWKVRGVDEPARRLAADGVPVWAYRWDWDEEGRIGFVDLSQMIGAAHGFEIPFVFGHFDLGPQTPLLFTDDNAAGRIALSERMMAYWAAFARDLDPGRGADGAGPLWAPWDPEKGTSFVHLDTGEGGIRMSAETLDLPTLLAELRSDARISDADERCEVFLAAVGWGDAPDIRTAADELGCTLPQY